jgi:MFS family permease
MTDTAATSKLPLALGAGVAGTFLIGELCPFSLPLMLTGIAKKFDLEPGAVGTIITAQLLAATIAAFLVAPGIDRLDRRKLALIGAALIIVGNLLSIYVASLTPFILTRVAAGIGEGLVQAAGIAACAKSKHAARLYSVSYLVIVLLSLTIYSIFPSIIVEHGFETLFLLMTIAVVAMLPTLLGIPSRNAELNDVSPRTAEAHRDVARFSSVHFATLVGFMLFYVGVNVTWYFMERIGEEHGLSLPEVGNAILIASIVALSGPIFGMIMPKRWAYRGPLIVAILLVAAASIVITSLPGFWTFAGGFALASTCYVFGIPIFYALGAAIDPSGRLPAALRGAGGIGNAVAPSIAGATLLVTDRIWSIGAVGALLCLANVAILTIFVFRRAEGNRSIAAHEPAILKGG